MKSKIYESKASQTFCQVCGLKMECHLQCAGCGVLIGPEHAEPEGYILKNLLYCRNCYKGRGGQMDE
jgi:hypothetical protein